MPKGYASHVCSDASQGARRVMSPAPEGSVWSGIAAECGSKGLMLSSPAECQVGLFESPICLRRRFSRKCWQRHEAVGVHRLHPGYVHPVRKISEQSFDLVYRTTPSACSCFGVPAGEAALNTGQCARGVLQHRPSALAHRPSSNARLPRQANERGCPGSPGLLFARSSLVGPIPSDDPRYRARAR